MINKIKFLHLFVVVIAITIILTNVSCEKEKGDNLSKSENIKLVTLTDENGFKSGITLLEFTSVEHYEATIEDLKNQIMLHEKAFLDKYSYLSGDLLDAKEEEIGFNQYQPLISFESKYSIPNSMRKSYSQVENAWLSNDKLDLEFAPANQYPFNMIEMSLLNANGEVKIGNSILKLTSEGFIYIANNDVRTLIRINSGDMKALKEATVTTNIELDEFKSSNDCSSWRERNYSYDYATNKKIIAHVHFHAYPWKGSSWARIESYKKDGKKWKTHRMPMSVKIQRQLSDKDCILTNYMESSIWNSKSNNHTIEKGINDWGSFPGYRVKKNVSVIGHFQFAGLLRYLELTW